MFAVFGLALCLRVLPVFPAVVWALTYGFWLSLAPILYVVYLLRTGRVAELHMSNTDERFLPYLGAIACALIMIALLWYFQGPPLLTCLTVFNAIELSALAFITTRYLISMHSAATTAITTLVTLIWGVYWGVMVGVPLITLVAVARLYLRRHTFDQVLAGWFLGAGTIIVMLPFGCF
ncbi:MAG: hypothetical protein QNJ45_25080 [Ardenticatenaceae bacterium]|nr:hypothetical protein [Ardenticatenaceae bacterium]